MAINDYQTALVTGASRGIGAATVVALRERGLEVHAVARSADDLARLASETGCIPHSVDITDKAALLAVLEGLEIDVLVNNAGTATQGGAIHDENAEDLELLLATNLIPPLNLIRACVPGMIVRDRGHVVNITSIAARHNVPGIPAYGSTKAALGSITQAMRHDLYGSRVRVTEIAPARVQTHVHAAVLGGDQQAATETFYDGFECLQPEDIASAIAYVVSAPTHMDVTYMEIVPTHQVIGGGKFHRASGDT
jgi:NADP-dependent 3-hydroxy acid dehydrogenase YdfG